MDNNVIIIINNIWTMYVIYGQYNMNNNMCNNNNNRKGQCGT